MEETFASMFSSSAHASSSVAPPRLASKFRSYLASPAPKVKGLCIIPIVEPKAAAEKQTEITAQKATEVHEHRVPTVEQMEVLTPGDTTASLEENLQPEGELPPVVVHPSSPMIEVEGDVDIWEAEVNVDKGKHVEIERDVPSPSKSASSSFSTASIPYLNFETCDVGDVVRPYYERLIREVRHNALGLAKGFGQCELVKNLRAVVEELKSQKEKANKLRAASQALADEEKKKRQAVEEELKITKAALEKTYNRVKIHEKALEVAIQNSADQRKKLAEEYKTLIQQRDQAINRAEWYRQNKAHVIGELNEAWAEYDEMRTIWTIYQVIRSAEADRTRPVDQWQFSTADILRQMPNYDHNQCGQETESLKEKLAHMVDSLMRDRTTPMVDCSEDATDMILDNLPPQTSPTDQPPTETRLLTTTPNYSTESFSSPNLLSPPPASVPNPPQQESVSENIMYRSAVKGSRAKQGLEIEENLCVTWAPDVYDPPPTSASHSVVGGGGGRAGSSRHKITRRKKKKKKTDKSEQKHTCNKSVFSDGSVSLGAARVR